MSKNSNDLYNSASDEELLARISLEEITPFSILFDRYKDRLFSFLKIRFALKNELIDEALQEIFLKVYLHKNDFDPELKIKFSSWIYKIAYNYTVDKLRHEKKFSTLSIDLATNESLLTKISDQVGIEAKTDFVKIFHKLQETEQEIVVLRFFEEKSYEEISDILQMPLGTVGTILRKISTFFKKELL